MKNPLVNAACALLFLLSGVAVAEYLVQSGASPNTQTPSPPEAAPPLPVAASPVAASPVAASPVAVPFEFPPEPAAETDSDRSAVVDPAVVDPEHAAQVRSLICRHLPHATDNVVDVLVEEYQSHDLDGVQFMLQQRQQLGLIMPASLTTDWDPTMSNPVAEASAKRMVDTLAESIRGAEEIIRNNLLCQGTPGYRRQIVVLDVRKTRPLSVMANHSKPGNPLNSIADETVNGFSGSDDDSVNVSAYSAALRQHWSFLAGAYIQTGDPMHVALPGDGSLIFTFGDGTVFSRRGDFQVLGDGTIGISTTGEEFSLFDSPSVTPEVTQVSVLQDGTVRGVNAAGDAIDLGRIRISRLLSPASLTSADGVFFFCGDVACSTPVDSVRLTTQTIELSNVVAQDEWAEMDRLRRMAAELLSLPADRAVPGM